LKLRLLASSERAGKEILAEIPRPTLLGVREWRNWQTQQVWNLLASDRLRGSTPLSLTKPKRSICIYPYAVNALIGCL
jgi:hypothetical protein